MTDSARDAFTYFDVDVSELTDDQCDQAADLIVARFDGQVPDVKQIVAVVAEVRGEVMPSDDPAGRNAVQRWPSVDRAEGEGTQGAALVPDETRWIAGSIPAHQDPDLSAPIIRRTIDFPGWHPVYPPLTLVPRRQEKLGPFDPHPACDVAYVDGGYVCSRCRPLLHPATCECDVCSEWMFKADEL